MLLAKPTMCPGASSRAQENPEISQLTLTWVLSPLSHLPPHQHTSHTFPEVWTPLLCHDKIIIPRAAAAMATPATENKGNELVVQDWWEELGSFGDALLTAEGKGKGVKTQNHGDNISKMHICQKSLLPANTRGMQEAGK